MAAISQFLDWGLWEKAAMTAMMYMERMSTAPAIARMRFHFTGSRSFLYAFFNIIAYKQKNGKKSLLLFRKT